MRLRRGRTVMASVALVGMGLVSPGGAVVSSAASAVTSVLSVHPIPQARQNAVLADLSFPPTTADCEAMFGIACYQPAQLQQAYDLHPLYNQGLTGAGSTIVIVDPFGSPTIASDLQVFDSTFGLPAPPSFQIIQPAGTVAPYPADPFGTFDRSDWA